MKAHLRQVQAGHEHEFEAAPGLPEPLPEGERVLWQGSPDWRVLARTAFHVRGISAYFAALLALRAGFALADGADLPGAARATLPLALAFGFALAMLLLVARLSARTTLYTLTDRRLVMRLGIVLTLTFNLPLRRLAGAGLALHGRSGAGDIPVRLAAPDKIAFVHLWPHVRPWRVARPEPMLRSVPDAERVAETLRSAWVAAMAHAPAARATAATAVTVGGAAQPAPQATPARHAVAA